MRTDEAAARLAELLNEVQEQGISVEIVPEPGSTGHMLALELPVGDSFERDDVMWTYTAAPDGIGTRWLVAPK